MKNIDYTIISICSLKNVAVHMPDTNNIIDSATTSTILKWAITILIAGFIAQFGKKFANFLTEKIRNYRKKKSETVGEKQDAAVNSLALHSEQSSPVGLSEAAEKARLKLEKKKAKAAAKEQKKKS